MTITWSWLWSFSLGHCPIYNYENGATVATSKNCSNFTYGCPNPPNPPDFPFHSDTFYLCKYSIILLSKYLLFISWNSITLQKGKFFLNEVHVSFIVNSYPIHHHFTNTKEKKNISRTGLQKKKFVLSGTQKTFITNTIIKSSCQLGVYLLVKRVPYCVWFLFIDPACLEINKEARCYYAEPNCSKEEKRLIYFYTKYKTISCCLTNVIIKLI